MKLRLTCEEEEGGGIEYSKRHRSGSSESGLSGRREREREEKKFGPLRLS